MALARLTVIDANFNVVLDEHVRPQGTVLDRNERFSGVKEGELESATLDARGVRDKLGEMIDEETIMVGHGLENDLKAMRIVSLRRWGRSRGWLTLKLRLQVHDKVIDTAIVSHSTLPCSTFHRSSLYLRLVGPQRLLAPTNLGPPFCHRSSHTPTAGHGATPCATSPASISARCVSSPSPHLGALALGLISQR